MLGRRSLARSIARAHCGGGGSVRLHRPSRALRAPRVTRVHAYIMTAHRARHHRFPFPLHARMRALRAATALARSLARSRACGAAVVMVVWRLVTPCVTRITRSTHHARARARHQRAIGASLPLPPPRAHARLRRSGSGARLLPRLRTRGVAGNAILGAFRCRFPPSHPTHPPPTIPSKLPRSSSPGTTMLGQSPLTRAHCGGGGARSLARLRALVVGCGGGGSVRIHRPSRALRASRVTRAYAYAITAHRAHHQRFSFPPCTTGTRALQRRRRSLARSIARARCGGGDGDGGCGRSRLT